MVGVLLTVDEGWRGPSIKKQTGAPTPEQSNTMLWTGTAEKHISAP